MTTLTQINGTELIHSISVDTNYTVVSVKEGSFNGMNVQAIHISEPRFKVMKDDKPTEETYFILIDQRDEAMAVTEEQFNDLLTQL